MRLNVFSLFANQHVIALLGAPNNAIGTKTNVQSFFANAQLTQQLVRAEHNPQFIGPNVPFARDRRSGFHTYFLPWCHNDSPRESGPNYADNQRNVFRRIATDYRRNDAMQQKKCGRHAAEP